MLTLDGIKQPLRLLCLPICLLHRYVLNILQILKRHLGICTEAFSILYRWPNGKQSWNKVWEERGVCVCNLCFLVKALWLCLGLPVTVFYSSYGTPPNPIYNQVVPKVQPDESSWSLFLLYIYIYMYIYSIQY